MIIQVCFVKQMNGN